MTNPPGTDLDLAALLDKGWAVRDDFPDNEYEKALAFYQAMREHDERLHRVRAQASGMIGGVDRAGCRAMSARSAPG